MPFRISSTNGLVAHLIALRQRTAQRFIIPSKKAILCGELHRSTASLITGNRSAFQYQESKLDLPGPESEGKIMLPDKIYEVLRWLVAVFMPALGVFFSTIAGAWQWNLPTEAILTTPSAVELFLSDIFGISKVIYDRKENPEKDL